MDVFHNCPKTMLIRLSFAFEASSRLENDVSTSRQRHAAVLHKTCGICAALHRPLTRHGTDPPVSPQSQTFPPSEEIIRLQDPLRLCIIQKGCVGSLFLPAPQATTC